MKFLFLVLPKYEIMQKKIIVGIDISAKTLDLAFLQDKECKHVQIKNDYKAICKFFEKFKDSKLVVAMENTGKYNWHLYDALPQFGFEVFVINPLHLSKSLGLTRGKNDKIDAIRIAQFINKNQGQLPQWRPASKALRELKVLLSERNARVKTLRRLKAQQKDYRLMRSFESFQELKQLKEVEIEQAKNQIKILERLIKNLIKSDKDLALKDSYIQSVPGIGKIVSWNVLSKTEAFTKITEARKMACYCGLAPFDYQSGTSVYRRKKVSVFADKKIKTILHMAAMRAVRLEGELKQYYQRKVKEGKNKMSVLNAVRNKLVHRIFAVVNQQKFYETNLHMS